MKEKTNFVKPSTISLSIPSFEKGLNQVVDSELLSMEYAVKYKNFSNKDGSLKCGIGFENIGEKLAQFNDRSTLALDLNNAGGFVKSFYFYKYNSQTNQREDKLIFISNSLQIYYINLFDQSITLYKINDVTFTRVPVATRYRLNGEDVIIFSSESDSMLVWDGVNAPYQVIDAPKISSMAVHYERLFVTTNGEKNSIWFSDDLDPTNWTLSLDEAGFIELIDERGALLKVVSFLDHLYIFREYGISRLTAYGDQTSFSVSNLFVSSGKIYADSVCICGDKIFFLASDGIYKFDGVDTVKVINNLQNGLKNVKNQYCSACYSQGSYYLACNFIQDNEEDLSTSSCANTLFEIDVNKLNILNISGGVYIKNLLSFNKDDNSFVIALVTNNLENSFIPSLLTSNGKYFTQQLNKIWKSPTTTIGDVYHQKLLKNIIIQSKGDITLTIKSDATEHIFNISGSEFPKRLTCAIPLYEFSFTISSVSSVCDIKNLRYEFSKLKRRV